MVHLNVSLILAAIAVAPVLANYGSPTTVLTTSSNVIAGNSANSSGITKAIPAEDGSCKQDAEMPDTCDGSNGWYPLSVVGREGFYCTHGPLCTGEIGNCPGPHGDLIYGSTCVSLSEGATGCVPNTECPTTESTKLEEDTPRVPSIAENCMVTPDTPSDKLSSTKSEETTYTPPEQTAQPSLQTEAPATAPPTLEETPFIAQSPAMVPPTLEEAPFIAHSPAMVPPTLEETPVIAQTPAMVPPTLEEAPFIAQTPAMVPPRLEETPFTAQTPAMVPPTLEETPVIAQTPAMVPPTSTESGTFSLPLTIETESLTDIPTPYATSKPETQSARDGGLKKTQQIEVAGASTDVLTSEPKALFPHSEDRSVRSEGSLASTVTKAPYPTLAGTVETKVLAAVTTDAPETDAPDSDAPDSDAPESEVLTIGTSEDRRLRRN